MKMLSAVLVASCLAFSGCQNLNECGKDGDQGDVLWMWGKINDAQKLSCYPNNCQVEIRFKNKSGLTLTGKPSTVSIDDKDTFIYYAYFETDELVPFKDGIDLTLIVTDLHTHGTPTELTPDTLDPKTQFEYDDTPSQPGGHFCTVHGIILGGLLGQERPVTFTAQ